MNVTNVHTPPATHNSNITFFYNTIIVMERLKMNFQQNFEIIIIKYTE